MVELATERKLGLAELGLGWIKLVLWKDGVIGMGFVGKFGGGVVVAVEGRLDGIGIR